MAAIAKRDPQRARIAMSEHFTVGVEPLTEHLVEMGVIQGSGPAGWKDSGRLKDRVEIDTRGGIGDWANHSPECNPAAMSGGRLPASQPTGDRQRRPGCAATRPRIRAPE